MTVKITLACTECKQRNYNTTKNKKNNPDRLELKKYCMTELRRMARSVPVEQLLEEIFASTGYLAALGVMENGTKRRDNFKRNCWICADFERVIFILQRVN